MVVRKARRLVRKAARWLGRLAGRCLELVEGWKVVRKELVTGRLEGG